jgi:TetR/AcrR family transcriptional regulator
MSREQPEASRLFANEILHGAPAIGKFLMGPLKTLVDEKAAVIGGWIAQGRLAAVDPHHLIFAIWATTQHYADFDVQVHAVLGNGGNHMGTAEKALLALIMNGLRPRDQPGDRGA